MFKKNVRLLTLVSLCVSNVGFSAVSLDRTRVVVSGDEKKISMSISNDDKKKPYLAQAWLEDKDGKKINSPLRISPPVQRLDPGKKSFITVTPTSEVIKLPQDRESLFYFSMREIPPKSDKPNVLQVALQTKIKLFYRPVGVFIEKNTRIDERLTLLVKDGGYIVKNPTPFHITVIALTGGEFNSIENDFKAFMVEPMSEKFVKSKVFSTPHLTTIDDFGGKPKLAFSCAGGICNPKLN